MVKSRLTIKAILILADAFYELRGRYPQEMDGRVPKPTRLGAVLAKRCIAGTGGCRGDLRSQNYFV